MRLKKQKRHRKVVRFYSACFGFREPYKVLCDGTFIHHILLHGLTPADKSLSNLLGARVLLFTSRCVIGELKSLGESHAVALEAAHQIMTATCDHEKRVDTETCIQSIIGESNSEHFFLATQDSEIRKKFREVVPGVPVIYGLRISLFLEQPSLNQKEFVKSTEEKRLHMDESEYKKIWKRELKENLSSTGAVSTSMEEFAKANRTNSVRTLGAVDKVRFKKRRAKGPNPLSCKKKKQNEGASLTKNQNGMAAGTPNKRKRNRKRKKEDKESKSEQAKS